VDTLGLILAVVVTAASVQDRDGAKQLLNILRHQYSRWRHIWADGAYVGPLVDWVRALRPRQRLTPPIVSPGNSAYGLA
jgi:hypothetical protein